ncbi:MAG: catalase [Comamonadaceae bacterium]|nr:MAG: catalase [Comamonadaceae bacterium]
MTPNPATPLPYRADYEFQEDDEPETRQELIESLLKISEIVARDEGHAHRSVHAKSHGLLEGRLEVAAGLPPHLAQGLFATPGSYATVLRLSTPPGDLLDDAVSTPRGVALKVLGVDGARVDETSLAQTQDFVMVNGPAFSASTAKAFLRNLKMLAATTDKAPGLKKALSMALRAAEAVIEKAGGESATLKALGGHPATHPLGEHYYTQAPVLFGPYMAKLSLAPVAPELLALEDKPLDLSGHPDALRDATRAFFAANTGVWELRVQLCTDIEAMPLEDASVPWSEEDSPYQAVARLVVPPQNAWSDARALAVDDGMAFSPWHALAAHRPLGSVMRVRRLAYEASAAFRAKHQGIDLQEPLPSFRMPD